MNVIKKIAIEVRPRLRSCTVALSTDADFADNYHLKVSVRPNFIVINYTEYDSKRDKQRCRKDSNDHKRGRKDSTSSCESYSDSEEETYEYSKFMNVAAHCRLIPSSLSSLKIESEFISFRVLTEPTGTTSSGTFYNESIKPDHVETIFECEKQTVNLQKQENVGLKCANCSHDISAATLAFDRVLELPSDNLDMSEWFCHKHSCDEKDSSPSLTPDKSDLFYGNCFFTVGRENLSPQFRKFNEKRTILYCNRCFFWLGTKTSDATSYKFWNCCVKFNRMDGNGACENFALFSYAKSRSTPALGDFLHVIRYGIKSSYVSPVSPSCKLLLECELADAEKRSLLIWVMDKSLDVLKSDVSHSESLDGAEESNEFKLELVRTSKLFYKIIDDAECAKNLANDPAVQTFEISKNMFFEGVHHLEAMAAYIPHSFKRSNDYFVTYLEL